MFFNLKRNFEFLMLQDKNIFTLYSSIQIKTYLRNTLCYADRLKSLRRPFINQLAIKRLIPCSRIRLTS
jgi:hypothetical protein